MSQYFQNFIKWPNLLNEHIFEKPSTGAKPKSLMNEIDELIMDMRPLRDTYPWDVEIIEQNVETEYLGDSQKEIYINAPDMGLFDDECPDFKIEINVSDLASKEDSQVIDEDNKKNIIITDSFLKNLSPHWLVEIIKAQKEAFNKEDSKKKPATSVCTELSSHYDLETPVSQVQPDSIPLRMLKKTYSEPSHRIIKKARRSRNNLIIMQSMDDVRQLGSSDIDSVSIKRRNNCMKRHTGCQPKSLILDEEPNMTKQNPTRNSEIPSGNKKPPAERHSTDRESETKSEKTSKSKVISWLESLPKDHKGIINARKIGKCAKEKPRWVN